MTYLASISMKTEFLADENCHLPQITRYNEFKTGKVERNFAKIYSSVLSKTAPISFQEESELNTGLRKVNKLMIWSTVVLDLM